MRQQKYPQLLLGITSRHEINIQAFLAYSKAVHSLRNQHDCDNLSFKILLHALELHRIAIISVLHILLHSIRTPQDFNNLNSEHVAAFIKNITGLQYIEF